MPLLTESTKADKAFIAAELSLSDSRGLWMNFKVQQHYTRGVGKEKEMVGVLTTVKCIVDIKQPHTCSCLIDYCIYCTFLSFI